MSEFEPLVSIIIPVYNGSDYLGEAIDSALSQTYKNIEIIVINDGSKDDGATEKIAKSYNDRIRYFAKENGGVASSLNLGIEKMNGELFSWLSHDDLYHPFKIKRQIEVLSQIDPALHCKTILFSDYDIKRGKETTLTPSVPIGFTHTEDPFYTYYMLEIFFTSKINGCTLLIPKNLFNEVGKFDLEHRTIQDYSLFVQFLKYGAIFTYMPENLIISRHHDGQDTHRLMDIHIKELNYLYCFTFDLFKAFFQKMPLWQLDNFLQIIKERTLDKVYAYMLSEWSNGEWNKEKPAIWMYWENKPGRGTPDFIRLCWKSVILNNKNDFQIKILTDDNINEYVDDLNPDYKLYTEIAHKADYIRFKLLYKYGGIWLDSDTAIFRSLDDIKPKIDKYGLLCSGYENEKKQKFILIGFLASKPGNEICRLMVEHIEEHLNKKIKKGAEQKWDEVGLALSDIINENKHLNYVFPYDYFSPYKIFANEAYELEKFRNKTCNPIFEKNIYAYGQAIAFSLKGTDFALLTESQLLNHPSIIGDMFRLAHNIAICINVCILPPSAVTIQEESVTTLTAIAIPPCSQPKLKFTTMHIIKTIISNTKEFGMKDTLNKIIKHLKGQA